MERFHLVNRGVEKRKVFIDSQDYARFLQDLFQFNREDSSNKNISRINVQHAVLHIDAHKNTPETLVRILAFCLMPNHYHILIETDSLENISKFMQRVNMGYSKYFNTKYDRTGVLWQGRFRMSPVKTHAHNLYVPYYIHANPLDMIIPEWRTQGVTNAKKALNYLLEYKWSSFKDYAGIKNFPFMGDLAAQFETPAKMQRELIRLVQRRALAEPDPLFE